MQLKNLDFLLEKCKAAPRMTLAVACPQGDDILEAVADAAQEGVVDPVLVGNRGKTLAIAESLGLDISGLEFVDEPDDALAAEKAVRMVSSGEAHLLMKGNVKTAVLLKAVLNKEWGLRSGSLLSHLFLFQVPRMPGVIGMSDGGMTMYPDLPTKVGIVENAVWAYHRIGVECPKIAALAAVEVVNPDMQATLDAAALAQMNRRGQIKGCLIDGPLALDNAVSAEAARIKGIESPVAGDADMLLVPSIEAGNFVGKVMMYMSGGKGAGVILGARRPIVLTSRFDNAETKRLSIAFGAVLAMS
ncbi:MAG TPA: bifunctional enoyl-CoA hydratase/phosphate acetyltransferase [Synergistales bacterium]|nr:bifunctional enoyl-CoA hydratase/phosphate acetyltransferase [Synergistales bacterium]